MHRYVPAMAALANYKYRQYQHQQRLTKRQLTTVRHAFLVASRIGKQKRKYDTDFVQANQIQVIQMKDGSVKLIRPVPPPENLIFQGGGGKGAGYEGVMLALEDAGQLQNVTQIVGTSAGALVATFFSVGNSAQDFKQFSSGFSPGELVETPKNFFTLYPTIRFKRAAGYQGGRAIQIADEVTSQAVAKFLRQYDGRLDGEFSRLRRLMTPPAQGERTQLMVTFKDLELLQKLDPRFKTLVLTGWNQDTQTLIYFSADSHPELPIPVAARASMSIPPAFRPIYIDGQAIADGGIGSNAPYESSPDATLTIRAPRSRVAPSKGRM